VVDVEVGREALFFGFVEHEDDLRCKLRVYAGGGDGLTKWSMRFLPTPGRSTWQGMPCCSNSSRAPIPERMRMAGLQYAPPETMISFRAWNVRGVPSAS
jgi:hypothetical protein